MFALLFLLVLPICAFAEEDHAWQWCGGVSDTAHEMKCSTCGETLWENHAYTQGRCTVCGYTEHRHQYVWNGEIYTSPDGQSQHGMICSDCGSISRQNHVNEANGVCIVCEYRDPAVYPAVRIVVGSVPFLYLLPGCFGTILFLAAVIFAGIRVWMH